VQAGKVLLAALKDLESSTRQDMLDGVYASDNDDSKNNSFTDGLNG
jgi:hypothetical protein